jgi:adenylate cyclase
MGDDEVATVDTLKQYLGIMSTLIGQYNGRVVDAPGDNLLAEFESAVDAVECAVKVQKELWDENADLPDSRKMQFRIGINLGDILWEDDTIYGNGVNITARIEGLADPGGICISRNVFDQVKAKLALEYEYMGAQAVKNISEPVRVYRVKIEPDKNVPNMVKSRVLPDKPSIAVLPFVNMSGDPEQEYFSDGITEDLITDLSRVSGLLVIARNSVFIYKGKAAKIEQVGRELGVRYVLEGSVRKVKDRVRITAQLVDASTSGHIWAERYDRDLEDIFALQDEVTQRIVSALTVKLTENEQVCRACKCQSSCNIEAYDFYLRGLESLFRFTKEANFLARKMFEKSIELDPQYAPAYSRMGETYLDEWVLGWNPNTHLVDKAFELANKAIALDESLSEPHGLLGNVYLWKRQHEEAIAELEKAISMNPNDADALSELGGILAWSGKPEESVGIIKQAMRLNPRYPADYLWSLGHAYFLMKQYEEAIGTFNRALNLNPNFYPSHFYLTASFSEQDREDEARFHLAQLLSKWPEGSLEAARQRLPYKDEAVLQRLIDALEKAGFK